MKRVGQLMPCHPSRFLKELPPELVEDADARDKQPLNPDAGKKNVRRPPQCHQLNDRIYTARKTFPTQVTLHLPRNSPNCTFGQC
jgi:hypothetical protein